MDPRVKAIRADEKIGRGTCSSIDECFTDTELVAELDREGITSPDKAVAHYREIEGIRNEVEDDVRGYGNLSPLHSPREPGRVYDDDFFDELNVFEDSQPDE